MYDLIIIGGGPAAISCAMVLGSAEKKTYMSGKKIGIVANQKSSDLKAALLNNLYGVKQGTKGSPFLSESLSQLDMFPIIEQLPESTILSISPKSCCCGGGEYELKTDKGEVYNAKKVVVATGHSKKVEEIEGLSQYIIKHEKTPATMEKFALKNQDNLVDGKGLYVAGVLSGVASQAVIAAGSGAAVAVEILTLWNNVNFDHQHDK